MKEKNVKCYIVNEDMSIFEYELLDKVKTFQVELIGKSNKRYVIANFKTLRQAKEYCIHTNPLIEKELGK